MSIELFDFQAEDVKYLGTNPTALIVNDMGTGKTFEALARDKLLREESKWGDKRTLVIAPLSTLSSWQEHCKLFNLSSVVVNTKSRADSWTRFTKQRADVFLIHWEGLRLMSELKTVQWLHIVADECHRAKSRKAQQTQALKRLSCSNKTAMSGTPVINHPHELWSILNWLNKKEYSAYWTFYRRYVNYEIDYASGGQYHKILGPKNMGELRRRIAPFTVRRRKEDVLPDLPDKYYTTVHVDLLPKQRQAYEEMRREMIAWIGENQSTPLIAPVAIAKLVRLQQFAAAYMEPTVDGSFIMSEPSVKLDVLMQMLADTDEQIVVFSQFKQLVRLATERFRKKGISFVEITGDVPAPERGAAIEEFQAGGAQVFIGTIAAGGVGITLTAASTVLFLDRSWSPALNLQAEDRLHRIGQKNAVQVIDLMAANTVDLGRAQRLEQKWAWIRELLDS